MIKCDVGELLVSLTAQIKGLPFIWVQVLEHLEG